jgi:predicted methyltransferase MtxX (methanogen marker protein 4)
MNKSRKFLIEDITKDEINSMIRSQIQSNSNSSELKKYIKKICAECLVDFTKSLWNKRSFWESEVTR